MFRAFFQRGSIKTLIASTGIAGPCIAMVASIVSEDRKSTRSSRILYSAHDEFPTFINHANAMARCLDRELYARLRDRLTSSGFTIDQVIQTGVDNPGTSSRPTTGVVAGDEHSYRVFRELYDRVLEDYFGYKQDAKHPDMCLDVEEVDVLGLDRLVSVRLRLCRNVSGFAFSPNIGRAERRGVEAVLIKAIRAEAGSYLTVANALTVADEGDGDKALTESMTLAEKYGVMLHRSLTPIWSSAGVSRDWPDGRGLFLSERFGVSVNDRDHLRMYKVIETAHLKSELADFFNAVEELEQRLVESGTRFAWDDHFGYLASSLANIGTGLKVSCLIKAPKLVKDSRLPSIIRSLSPTHSIILRSSNAESGEITIENRDRVGVSELDIVQRMLDSTRMLSKIEEKLEKNQSIDDLFAF